MLCLFDIFFQIFSLKWLFKVKLPIMVNWLFPFCVYFAVVFFLFVTRLFFTLMEVGVFHHPSAHSFKSLANFVYKWSRKITYHIYLYICFQNKQDSTVLQLAPTIYHQCVLMMDILKKFKWTNFAIVTTTTFHYLEFTNAIEALVKEHNQRVKFDRKSR